jgi:hypothetical protein
VDYLKKRIPQRTLIETPEYELVFLDNVHRIHLMPAFYIVESGEQGVKLLNPRRQPYNFNQVKADVLILGYFGKSIFAQIYSPAQVARYWRKVAQVDCYDIYVRRSSPLLRPPDTPVRLSAMPPLSVRQSKVQEAHGPDTLPHSFSH